MDEIFGYENFVNEIIWQRTGAHNDPVRFGVVHDTLLVYGISSARSFAPVFVPLSDEHISSRFNLVDPGSSRRYFAGPITAPGDGVPRIFSGKLIAPPKGRHWSYAQDGIDELVAKDLIYYSGTGTPYLKQYMDDYIAQGRRVQDVWTDSLPSKTGSELLGYPTQKPLKLLDRVIASSSPPSGLVLDCFHGSGTTAEAAERLGRRWIGIDNGKYAIHLARKRLIQLHGQPRPPEKPTFDYSECGKCGSTVRREKSQRSPGPFQVRPFTVENMGVYQRASEWQGFQQHRSAYRDEMIRVFGGEPIEQSMLLHGKKGAAWVHVGPLDGPVSVGQVWAIARDAQRTSMKAVTILSADFDTLSGSEKEDIKKKTGVGVTIRVIPSNAIDEVRRRLEIQRVNPDVPVESMAIPAFYAPLSIVLDADVTGRSSHVKLVKCEVDIDSFIASQRPMLKPITEKMSAAAKKKAQGEIDKWEKREKELHAWLKKAKSWQSFIDFWAVDWNYGRVPGEDGKPIFVTEWQSFRSRGGEGDGDLVFTAKFSYPAPGQYTVAARVTDVFGNDGIATLNVEVKR
jgi:adenine-specific DNA-methyltransferase